MNTTISPAGMLPARPEDPRRTMAAGSGMRSSTRHSGIHPEGPDDPLDPDLPARPPSPLPAPDGRLGSTITRHPAKVTQHPPISLVLYKIYGIFLGY